MEGEMFSRTTCIFIVITVLAFLYGYTGKSSLQAKPVDNADDADLVQIVLSSPGNVGPLGVIARRSCNEKTRETALNELLSRHPDWNWELIQRKRIQTGMTDHEVRLSWGNPYQINHESQRDRWVHVWVSRFSTIKNVYIENGRVTAWN